jgi:hypothetical protein
MQWGIDQEPFAKEAFTLATDMQVIDTGFVEHPTIDNWAHPRMASLNRKLPFLKSNAHQLQPCLLG